MDPSTDSRDTRIALLERLFQSAVARADALELEVPSLREEARLRRGAVARADARELEVATLREEARLHQGAVERVQALEKELAALKEENAELKRRVNLNSQNSSKSPSTDGPEVKRPPGKPRGRKRGGQPGHDGAERRLLPPDKVIDHLPKRCRKCAHALTGSDSDPTRFQGLELRCQSWHVEPLEVEEVRSSFFDDPALFPPGSIAFDCALLMRGIDHEWHGKTDLCCPSAQQPAVLSS